MSYQADVLEWLPGERVPTIVHADSNGAVATRGDGVEASGEREEYLETQLVETEGHGLALLLSDPEGYDSSKTYNANEEVGKADMLLVKPVIRVTPAGSYTPTVGDHVAFGDGGTVVQQTGVTATGLGGAVTNNLGVDGNGNLETNAASDIDVPLRAGLPFGEVIATYAHEFGQGDKIAVAVHR